jgi:hypothetical protein
MSNVRLRLAFVRETAWGNSRFATPLPAHRPTEVDL